MEQLTQDELEWIIVTLEKDLQETRNWDNLFMKKEEVISLIEKIAKIKHGMEIPASYIHKKSKNTEVEE